jgi:rod shape determining protein RodA
MERPWHRSFNWALAGASVVAALLGITLIHSATLHDPSASAEAHKQVTYVLAGIAAMAVCARTDYRSWKRWALPLFFINFALLGLVLKMGHSALGAQRWLPLGPLGTFQPSEPAKLIVAVTTAALISRIELNRLRLLVLPLVGALIPALLILKQPDLGTALVIFAILSAEMFFGVEQPWLFGVYAAGAALAGSFVLGTNHVLKKFQRDRLMVFLNPGADPQGAGWNLNQSKIAVGSGELIGKGLYRGTQTQLNFVPEHSRDFIFTVLGEELGFVGACVLLALYAMLLYGGLSAMFAARDRFGFLLSAGIVAMFAFHIVVNIGMTVGIMPITGIPLPFLSYGGSAVITDFAAVGILLNIHLQRDRLTF